MTEVKTESQSTRITQTQPSAKRQPAKSIAEPSSASESNPERGTSLAESTTEATPTKKRRTTKTEKAPTTKRQATSKSPNQSASTRVKLAWEAPPSERGAAIEAVLAQFNEQLNATWSAIDELKATVEKMQTQDGTRPSSNPHVSTVQLPLEAHRPVQTTLRPPQPSIPPFRPSIPTARPRRRKPLHRLMQQLLRLPEQNSGIAIDAALWVLAAAGLRIGLKYLVVAMPILNFPVTLLIFVPALLAAYAALFIPQANRIGIYRLLLVTLGLFVGGKL
ncbi:MAG: hypothetical protein KME10_09510 [Plectolyngbya sp. WJT66-NPBG17]|jgi:hypothetical protein|nr:hypothetical protein [Plectolyngbya sp. WJT66-NPBG17]